MNKILWIWSLWICCSVANGQVLNEADPDSVLAEWIESGEWAGVSLHPDIVMDWLLDLDTSSARESFNRPARNHLLTISIPVKAELFNWYPDSTVLITPVSMKYRFKIREARRWEFRMQASQYAGDTCLSIPKDRLPEEVSAGFLVRPGSLLQEVIIGDFQVNSGFGAVTGSSPVFSVSLGNPGSLHRAGTGIRLHSGASESRYFRGVAAVAAPGKSQIIVYGSGRDRLSEAATGFACKRSFSGAEVGMTGIRVSSRFPTPIREGWTAAWQPDSGHYGRAGLWGQARVPFGIIFGEAGWSPDGGMGWIGGVRFFEAHGFSAVVRASGCTPGYPVAYTLFQSGTSLTKEGQRIIASFRYSRSRSLEWLGSAEIERSQWPGNNAHFTHSSTRLAQQLKITSKNLWVIAGTLQLDFLEPVSLPGKLSCKLALDSDPGQSGTMRFRAGIRQNWQGFGENITMGTTADFSIGMALAGRRLRLTGGFRVFTVEPGTDPLYAYEPDILYGFSAPVLSGSGTRWFATVRWKILETMELEIKISQNSYTDLKHLSEGNTGGLSGKVQVGWRIC